MDRLIGLKPIKTLICLLGPIREMLHASPARAGYGKVCPSLWWSTCM